VPTPVPTPPPTQRPATPVSTPPPPPPPPGVATSALAAGLIDLINQQRAARGLGALIPNAALIAASNQYAAVQWAHDPYALNHNLDGNALDRALRQGYYGWIGEVLATGNPSAQELVNLWMASPSHSTVLLGSFVHIGVGCQEGPYTANGVTYQIAVCVGMVGTPVD
jgi:uncharacterized protein YkwD